MTQLAEGVGDVVLYEKRHDHIAVVTLNRPAARNAVDGPVTRAIDSIVADSEADDKVRAVVLASSHETVFCAGADLVEISRGNADQLSTERGGFAGLARAARIKPWVAAIQGAALAGGCELALSCDMIVASNHARFGVPEVKRGLFAGAAGPYRLMKTLPRNIALELLATGDPIAGDRAFAFGLVNRLCGQGEALDAAIELALAIAVNAPLAVRETLKIARRASELDEATYWRESDEVSAMVFASADAQEGPRAFLEKRAPVWTGQ